MSGLVFITGHSSLTTHCASRITHHFRSKLRRVTKSEQKRLAQTVTLWYINLCKQILVPRTTVYAYCYHNRTLGGRASRPVRRTAASSLWSLVGLAHSAAAFGREE